MPQAPLPLLTRRALLALAAACPPGLRAQGDQPRDTLVKAAFLHKFASFVEWPQGTFAPDTPLRIGVVGDEQVWRDLRDLARDRDRDGRLVSAVRLVPGDSFAGLHILYVRVPPARIGDLLAQVPEGVLTVADTDGRHPDGAVISFFLEGGRVRFGASLEAAARQKLRLSSRLLSVARVGTP
jgi:hypothetical protein